MRVLWFTNFGGNYPISSNAYNGEGWVRSLESIFHHYNDVELSICFSVCDPNLKCVTNGNVSYYPVCEPPKTLWQKVGDFLFPNIESRVRQFDKIMVEKYLDIIKKTNPDVIEIFGSEKNYGLVAGNTQVPILLHLQGLLSPLSHTFFPPGFSYFNYLFRDINPLSIRQRYYEWHGFKYFAKREKKIIYNINNFLGRTKWDEAYVKCLNPHCCYFFGGEMLRDVFYKNGKRCVPNKLIIISTISSPFYKGYDYVLRTAEILRNEMSIDFEWHVWGNISPEYIEKIVGISHREVNVLLKGVADEITLKQELLNATVYVHPSYIENSPNSVCEAQICGCPVIASNVGGISSLIEDGETGLLVPANDPYMLCYKIKTLFDDRQLNEDLGRNAMIVAQKRHDNDLIYNNLIKVYHQIIEKQYN